MNRPTVKQEPTVNQRTVNRPTVNEPTVNRPTLGIVWDGLERLRICTPFFCLTLSVQGSVGLCGLIVHSTDNAIAFKKNFSYFYQLQPILFHSNF